MSRAKSRCNNDVCADCGAPEPTWAALNRGILLCIQCCSIHRSLGRRISQIKSLHKSNLAPSQLSMLHALNNSGANSIWEHTLLENGSKLKSRKPTPKDSLECKLEFIKSKHERLAFVFRPHNEDGLLCVENELGKQLHASVRTGNLDTSFRLLVQGADPNYFHDEKGTTPLHVAAKANQKEQAELLMVYGADPTFPDVSGLTPIDYAKQNVNKDIYHRLIENQYEITDKFSYYLNFRKPDHVNGVHFIIPQVSQKISGSHIEKLQKLPNHVFEELVIDVYDEIDRREIELIWTSSAEAVQLSGVPFLPVDPTLSTTRNQSRQKLGRFTTPELKALVQDILNDTERRRLIPDKYSTKREVSQMSDDDPVYDSVASDDDYAIINPTKEQEQSLVDGKIQNTEKHSDENHNPTSNQMILTHNMNNNNGSNISIDILTKKLQESQDTISDLKNEVTNLKALVEHLSSENFDLKSKLSQISNEPNNSISGLQSIDVLPKTTAQKQSVTNGQVQNIDIELRSHKKPQRPSSMYETREGLKTPNWQHLKSMIQKNNEHSRNTIQGLCSVSTQSQEIIAYTEHVTKCIQELWNIIQSVGRENCVPFAGKIRNAVNNLTQALPSFNVVITCIENVAVALKAFWYVIQGDGKRNCVNFACKLINAVNNMTYCFPLENNADIVRHILDCVHYLHVNCMGLQTAYNNGDEQQIELYMQKVRKCAYEIAKDTKQLVTKYTSQ